jgi:integrase/recombinase XerD
VRDKRYRETALAHDVVDWLAWLELGGAAERTLDQYERDLARLCLLFPEKGLQELSDADIAHCLTLFSPKQRRVRAAAIQSFWKWAVRTRRTEKNPMDTLPVIKAPPQKYIETFTDAEVEALQALPPVDAVPMKLLFESGIRKGEARALRLADILPDPPPGRLVILGGKGGKDRVIPVTEGLARAVAELTLLEGLENADHVWYGVHANASGSRLLRHRVIADSTFHRWWGRCIETAGVRYRNPHVTRHTFATNWLRRGGRLETLSLVMGHASIRTTFALYGHLDTRDAEADLAIVFGQINPEQLS